MKEIVGNIWDYHAKGHWIVITTSGSVSKDGAAVMGRGVALQAKQRFPELPEELGYRLSYEGNLPFEFRQYRILTFPVKSEWWQRANVDLIEQSWIHLRCVVVDELTVFRQLIPPIYMVRPGCGNGGLDWEDVKPILEKYLDDRFVVVEIGERR